ncbi:hypothetical protein F4813DRAFT_385586 [Daldinia decipiens]|uniref:uncharacterized protein n=1 Tax=Daldinia decipiens TaxID=326647 RepID=UPI0020C3C6B1|nr:uncharacterized protein F4813DRAFT_385586 [Daldinia decipiens]KAI1661915.1 hypothetical protein F4813DRAFT_385586 [Daldinia decipiens]
MDTEAYGAVDELGRTIGYHGPTMTFEPLEYSSTSLKPPGLITPLADTSNTLLSNIRHQRQQSAPNVYYSNADSRSPSPKSGHVRHQSQGMPLTGDGRAGRRSDNSSGRYGTRLSATQPSSSADEATSPNTTPKSKCSIATSDTTPKSATQPRLGFFASLTTRLSSPAAQTPQEVDDEIINMDIEAALYPSAIDRDTFSPAAYKNLQANAAGLLHKMQDAYRQRAATIREMRAEREAYGEETAETELRIRSFKSQLESMAAKAVEQEKTMQLLVAELLAEKEARREAEDRGRALVESPLITEDLCVDDADREEGDDADETRKRWRNSDGTVRSDLSIDTSAGTSVTDGESVEADSIFSRSRSPTATVTTTMTETELLAIRSPHTPNLSPSPKPKQQLTAFQKLVKGISGGGAGGEMVDGCGNCRGRDASVAWETVSLLRDENKNLKHRVAQLEVVVEGALDVVNGIGA